jgi:hypothetical protein
LRTSHYGILVYSQRNKHWLSIFTKNYVFGSETVWICQADVFIKYFPVMLISNVLIPIWIWIRLINLMPIRIRILPQVLYMLENLNTNLDFFHWSAILHCFILRVTVITFNILDSIFILEFFGKKYSSAFLLVERNTDLILAK